jgi:hypothetical protein
MEKHMDDINLIPGLLALATQRLQMICEYPQQAASLLGDRHDPAALASAHDMSASALARTAGVIGDQGLSGPGGRKYVPWSLGPALGFRASNAGERDQFIYIAAADADNASDARVLIYAGPHGDPHRDEVICRAPAHQPQPDGAPDHNLVTVWLSTEEEGRLCLGPLVAARLVVSAYRQRAEEIEINAGESAFNAYWAEVQRLLAAGPPASSETNLLVTVRHKYPTDGDAALRNAITDSLAKLADTVEVVHV